MSARDRSGKTALHYCTLSTGNKSLKLAAMLLNRDLSILDAKDENGNTALQQAVMVGNAKMVRFLVKQGADVRTRDNEGHTLIHWATGRYVLSQMQINK